MKGWSSLLSVFIAVIYFMTATPLSAQNSTETSRELGEVTVTAKRPMKDIGVQKTTFDSIALKENIALSMADILTFNSPLYVKNYGRATLSTVAFRGTSPGHTQVTWNGMKINNPMMGMTDFSTIPAFFIDRASLLHGTSSVNEAGGALGGLVRLGTNPDAPDGFFLQYIQGIGSFKTFDEFLRFSYCNDRWTNSTRAVYSSSPNDYTYINRDKKVNIYDDEHNIIGQYYPKEKNRSGAYKDLHILQEVYYTPNSRNRFGLNAWYINSNRELPLLTTDYGDERKFENRQRENTFRAILSFDHFHSPWFMGVKAGYIFTWMGYDYKREISEDNWSSMTRSRSHVNALYGQAEWNYTLGKKWFFSANVSLHQFFVRSEDKNIIMVNGDKGLVGYDKARLEFSGAVSAKWQPIDPLGMSVVIREETAGKKRSQIIPAFFIDWQPVNTYIGETPLNLMFKGSVSRNYRFPTLNDLYFLPGGNPDLKDERGFTYDLGLSFETGFRENINLTVGCNWFDSHIDDWIIWLPSAKGYFSPRNLKKVHAYGVETSAQVSWNFCREWLLDFNGNFSWTPSINEGKKLTAYDQSVGKQLPYVPRYSAAFTGRLTWKSWSFLYKWAYYSERFTMTSNAHTLTGKLPDYFMSNISLEKLLSFRPLDIRLKLAVNNLFNEDYLSVLSRPMPGINFEFFICITPKFLNPAKP